MNLDALLQCFRSTKKWFSFYVDFYDGYGNKLRTERGIVQAFNKENAEEIVRRRLCSGWRCTITIQSMSLDDDIIII